MSPRIPRNPNNESACLAAFQECVNGTLLAIASKHPGGNTPVQQDAHENMERERLPHARLGSVLRPMHRRMRRAERVVSMGGEPGTRAFTPTIEEEPARLTLAALRSSVPELSRSGIEELAPSTPRRLVIG